MDREEETRVLNNAFDLSEAIQTRDPLRLSQLISIPLDTATTLLGDPDKGGEKAINAYIDAVTSLRRNGIPPETAYGMVDLIVTGIRTPV